MILPVLLGKLECHMYDKRSMSYFIKAESLETPSRSSMQHIELQLSREYQSNSDREGPTNLITSQSRGAKFLPTPGGDESARGGDSRLRYRR